MCQHMNFYNISAAAHTYLKNLHQLYQEAVVKAREICLSTLQIDRVGLLTDFHFLVTPGIPTGTPTKQYTALQNLEKLRDIIRVYNTVHYSGYLSIYTIALVERSVYNCTYTMTQLCYHSCVQYCIHIP
jgi:hypothetical protein